MLGNGTNRSGAANSLGLARGTTPQANVDEPVHLHYESIRKRRGTAIATVAIVRRLLAQSFHIPKEVS